MFKVSTTMSVNFNDFFADQVIFGGWQVAVIPNMENPRHFAEHELSKMKRAIVKLNQWDKLELVITLASGGYTSVPVDADNSEISVGLDVEIPLDKIEVVYLSKGDEMIKRVRIHC